MINKSITPELEQKLTISNLTFLAINKLSLRQLEIMKKIKQKEEVLEELELTELGRLITIEVMRKV